MVLIEKLKSKVFTNSIWMMSEKLISIFGLIFVTSFVAKYIGPENFGKLTFASSIFAIIQTIAMFGSENIIFQKTAENRRLGEYIIVSTKIIRDILYLSFSSLTLFYIYYVADYLTFVFSLATSIAIYFAVHDVYLIYFNAILQSKINAYCNILALIISLIIRYCIAKFQLAVELLCIPIIMITLVPFFIRKYLYAKKKVSESDVVVEKFKRYRKFMLGVGRKLALYTLSVAIFTKTSQLFLGIKSQYDLGIYTVAMTLGNSFYFALVAIISSYFTQIYVEKDFEKSQKMVAKLSLVIILICLSVLLFFSIVGPYIVNWLYGSAYVGVNNILLLAVVVTMFSGLSTVAEKYLLKFNAYDYLKKKTLYLVVFNIMLTAFCVHQWGLNGAVFAILLTEIMSFTIFNYFYKNGIVLDAQKRIFFMSTYK
ncbi:Polysaccharide biosynthesis protein [Acinetobacter baumannii]|uniref:polysaccharide biosynthesis protein n=1 Tax=Acinetobacter baumannii TaxID=470 RepID=UPI000DE5F41B|nr:polysaccharide biosynthesis protein [Acinetobacter baumannii]AYX86017.1 polysaccharide biosynthesis protein [Acinetobacter baumannii]MCJ9202296.1 polysaccharide biosynthesis protein [Acinetobacter baumannii]MCJ9352245.1 polysaccharide biosynthesis protein [Acinetobacter baumannii]MCR0011006.1 polysaccharide biosynthesis protein [Acinetobacter baumannii]MDA4982139.1 polysaccharide biosynthesis protein [Acinetobacter baumannii]